MVMLNKIEKYIAYRSALELIAHDEAYDKKKNVLSGEELFKLCYERYLLMEQVLLPLKEKLGKRIEITNVNFAEGIQDDTYIIVEYLNEGKKNYFTLSHLEYDGIETIFNTGDKEIKTFIDENKKDILEAFASAYRYSFDRDLCILTTSKQFAFTDDTQMFSLKDSLNGQVLSISSSYTNYEKNHELYIPNATSRYNNLEKVISDNNNARNVIRHAKVYEEALPKVLIKK